MPEPSSSDPAPTPKESLPPGTVLGPDGKPCRVCSSFKSWTKQQSSRAAGAASASAMGTALASLQKNPSPECPPDREQLGRHTWTFLHTTAAYYPVRPTEQQQGSMRALINALGTHYPCGDCAEHLRGYLKRDPPDVGGRTGLEQWMCRMHNEVNLRLGKDEFDCSRVGERWRDGWKDGSCD